MGVLFGAMYLIIGIVVFACWEKLAQWRRERDLPPITDEERRRA